MHHSDQARMVHTPGELVVVGEVVDALPVVEMHGGQLMVDPPACDGHACWQAMHALLCALFNLG